MKTTLFKYFKQGCFRYQSVIWVRYYVLQLIFIH